MSSLEQFGYKQELKRALTAKDLVVYGMIFHGADRAVRRVRLRVGTTPKGWCRLLTCSGLLGMFFTAMSYASMSRAFPVAGFGLSYVQRGLHDVAGSFPAG